MAEMMAEEIPTGTGQDDPLVVVSSDCHVSPTLETLGEYCPKKYREDFASWIDETKSIREMSQKRFVFEGDDDLPEVQKIQTWNLQTEGHRDIGDRMRDMDFDGIAAEVMFHGSAPFEPIPFMATSIGYPIENFEHSAVGQHMYNEWLAEFSLRRARTACRTGTAADVGYRGMPQGTRMGEQRRAPGRELSPGPI